MCTKNTLTAFTASYDELQTPNINNYKKDSLVAQRGDNFVYSNLLHEDKYTNYDIVTTIQKSKEDRDYLQAISQTKADQEYLEVIAQCDKHSQQLIVNVQATELGESSYCSLSVL